MNAAYLRAIFFSSASILAMDLVALLLAAERLAHARVTRDRHVPNGGRESPLHESN